MTSFSRLAKVIKGYTPPVGWIERAFASLITAINSVLPEYTISDVDKVLTIDKDEGHEVTKHIVNEQSVTTNASGRADLAANSWDFSGLEANEEVTVLIGGVGATFTFLDGSLWGASDEQITSAGRLLGFSHSATFTISCSKTVTEYDPVLDWKAVRQTPVVGTNDKGKYLHTNDSTGDLEWGAVRQTPAVGADDKDKYLHTNASTGALEWSEADGGGETFEVIDTQAGDTHTLNKTMGEIEDAVEAGKTVWIENSTDNLKTMLTIFRGVIEIKGTYVGTLGIVRQPSEIYWYVYETTEAAARNSYPSYQL